MEFISKVWVNLRDFDKSLSPSFRPKLQPNYTSLSCRVLDHSDFLETVFSTVNLFLLVDVLALRCSFVKLSLLNLLLVVIFQPTQISLYIIHTKFLKEVIGGPCLLSIVNGFLSTDGIPDYFKKESVQPFLQKRSPP